MSMTLFVITNNGCNYNYRQVEGRDGIKKLFAKFKVAGPSTFYHGSIAAASATFVGHYPWFFVYNYLSGIYYYEYTIS